MLLKDLLEYERTKSTNKWLQNKKMCTLIIWLIYLISTKDMHHSTIKSKSIYVKSSIFFDIGRQIDNKDPKFKVGDHVITSK